MSRALSVAGIILLALAVSVTAVFLGRWQWHRHEARAEQIMAFEAGQSVPPAPLSQVVPDAAVTLPDEARWRTAQVSGVFDAGSLTWLRNRPVAGAPASHALAWFVTDDGRALLVDAGWVEAENTVRPDLPTEHLNLTVTLRPAEDDNGSPGTRITPAQMPEPPAPAVAGYGVLAEACQDPCGPLPGLAITPLPELSLGPHLAYAVQWYMLAVAAPIVAVIWIRRELKGPQATVTTGRPKRRTGLSDEEIEDAL